MRYIVIDPMKVRVQVIAQVSVLIAALGIAGCAASASNGSLVRGSVTTPSNGGFTFSNDTALADDTSSPVNVVAGHCMIIRGTSNVPDSLSVRVVGPATTGVIQLRDVQVEVRDPRNPPQALIRAVVGDSTYETMTSATSACKVANHYDPFGQVVGVSFNTAAATTTTPAQPCTLARVSAELPATPASISLVGSLSFANCAVR